MNDILLFHRPGTNGYVYLEITEDYAYFLHNVLDQRFDFEIPQTIANRHPEKAGEVKGEHQIRQNLPVVLQYCLLNSVIVLG